MRGVQGHLLQTISNFSSKRPIDESAKRNWTNSVFTPGLWDGTGTVPFHTLSVQPSPCRINCKIKPWRAKCIKKLEYVSTLEIRRKWHRSEGMPQTILKMEAGNIEVCTTLLSRGELFTVKAKNWFSFLITICSVIEKLKSWSHGKLNWINSLLIYPTDFFIFREHFLQFVLRTIFLRNKVQW